MSRFATVNIGQEHLNAKLYAYCSQEASQPLTKNDAIKYIGLCFGWAVYYSFCATTGRSDEYFLQLFFVSQWDPHILEQLDVLVDFSSTTFNESKQLRLRDVMREVHDHVVLNYGAEHVSDIQGMSPHNFFTKTGFFDSERGRIICSETAVGYFVETDLDRLLQENLFSHEGIFLVHCEYSKDPKRKWIRHACAIRFDANSWYFYDPDTRETRCSDKAALIHLLTNTLGHSLAIVVASWDERIADDLQIFQEAYINLVSQEPRILNEFGLHMMLQYSDIGTVVPMIFESAKTNLLAYKQLINALMRWDCQNQHIGLHYINHHAPKLRFIATKCSVC